MLDKLGFRKRVHVGISISVNNVVELMYVDKKNKGVSRYATGNIKYNSAIREIIDMEEFSDVIQNLFQMADLEPSECAVTLSLPNVCFGITPLENSTEQAYIIENLQAELEDLYIFKRNEPIISYSILNGASPHLPKNIVYSAIQGKVVAKILEIFDHLGIEIEKIDTSYASLIRTLKYSDRFSKFVMPEEKTALILITANSCCSFILKGGNVISFKEQPLAVKSFSPEEVFSAIASFVNGVTQEEIPQSLLIVSETDDVSPELLVDRIDFSNDVDYVGVNTNTDDQIISTDMCSGDNEPESLQYMSLSAIGAAVANYDDFDLNINFLPADRVKNNLIQVGAYEIEFTRYLIILLLFAIVSGAVLGGALNAFLAMQVENQSIENAAANQEITEFENRLKEGGTVGSQANVFPVMQKIMNSNKAIFEAYSCLSTDIPDSIYIRKFVTNAEGGIGIVGESSASEDVEKFVSKIKEKNDDLMVAKLSVNTKNDPVPAKIPNGYTFEIKTTGTDIDLNADDTSAVQGAVQDTVNAVKNGVGNIPSGGSNMAPPPAPVI